MPFDFQDNRKVFVPQEILDSLHREPISALVSTFSRVATSPPGPGTDKARTYLNILEEVQKHPDNYPEVTHVVQRRRERLDAIAKKKV